MNVAPTRLDIPAVPSDSGRAGAGRAAWYALWVLVALVVLRYIDQVVLTIGIEPMRKELALSDAQIGMVQGLGITLAAAIGGVPLAWLADRFGRTRVLALAVLFWSVATAVRTFSQGFGHVMGTTAGMAVAEAALMPIAYAIIPGVFKGRQLALANLILYACGALGYSVAMMAAGQVFRLIDAHPEVLPPFLRGLDSWRTASFMVGAIGPVFALLTLTIRAGASTPAQVQGATHPEGLTHYLRANGRALLAVYGSCGFAAIALGPLMAWLAPALARQFGLSPAQVGSQVGVLYLASSVAGIGLAGVLNRVLGRGARRLLPVRVGPLLTVIAAAVCGMLLMVESIQAIYAAVFVAVTLLVGFNSLMPTVYQLLTPEHLRARVMAVAFSVLALASAAGPIAVGVLSDRMFPGGRQLLMACAAIAAPFLLLSAALLRWGGNDIAATIELVERNDAVARERHP